MSDGLLGSGVTNQTPNSIVVLTSDRLAKPWKFSEKGMAFLKDYEKFSAKMYNDEAMNATIGYGFKIHDGPISGKAEEAPFKNGITEGRATDLFKEKILEFESAVNKAVLVPLFQYEYDALIAFSYNVGVGGFLRSTALKKLNQGCYEEVPAELLKYSYITKNGEKKLSPGLQNRRLEEVEMFAKSDYRRQR